VRHSNGTQLLGVPNPRWCHAEVNLRKLQESFLKSFKLFERPLEVFWLTPMDASPHFKLCRSAQ